MSMSIRSSQEGLIISPWCSHPLGAQLSTGLHCSHGKAGSTAEGSPSPLQHFTPEAFYNILQDDAHMPWWALLHAKPLFFLYFNCWIFLRMQDTAFSGPDDRAKLSPPSSFTKKTLIDPKSGVHKQGPCPQPTVLVLHIAESCFTWVCFSSCPRATHSAVSFCRAKTPSMSQGSFIHCPHGRW